MIIKIICITLFLAQGGIASETGNQKYPKDVIHSKSIKGIIRSSALDSSVESTNGKYLVGFITNSEVGMKIFTQCKSGDMCEINGTMKNEFFISVSSAKKID